MTIEKLLSIYVDTNILLIFAALTWLVARRILKVSSVRHLYLPQLQIIYWTLLTIILAPFLLFAVGTVQALGWFGESQIKTVSDIALAQFLNGNIDMAPSSFESILMLRSNLTHEVATFGSWLGTGLGVLFAGGICLFAARFLIEAWRVHRLIKHSFLMRKIGKIDIRLTDQAVIPFSTLGISRYHIVLPSTLLSRENDVRVAVSHEVQHIRQGDLFWEVFLEVMRPIFFWNPFFYFWKSEVERLRELACDQQVLAHSTFGVRDYCECLLRVCKDSLSPNRKNQILMPSVPFAKLSSARVGTSSAQFLKFRVRSILGVRAERQNDLKTAILALPVLVTVTFGAFAFQEKSDWSHDRLMLATIVNLERLDIRNGIIR